jgi:DNA mismatch repair protein MutS
MKETSANMIIEYLNYHKKYYETYNTNMFVLMEVGSFYEAYTLEPINAGTNKGADLNKLSDMTDMHKSFKQDIMYSGVEYRLLMCGFPTHSQDKFISMLLDNGMTLIMVDQVGENPNGSKLRKVTKVLSPGTAIDIVKENDPTGNNLVCLVFNKGKDPSTKKPIFLAGISVIDFVTGNSYCTQIESTPDDNKLWLDECFRIIHSYSPKEVILAKSRNCDAEVLFTEDYLIKEFECDNKPVHYIEKIADKYYKPAIIEDLLTKVFPNHTCYSACDYLDLSYSEEARTSFVFLLQFAYEHDLNIIEKIKKPINENSSNTSIISNNAIYQLDLVSQSNGNCLMKLLNKCSTLMGKRKYQYRLLHPITDFDTLNTRYGAIDKLKDQGIYKKIKKDLTNIRDIEKIHRRIGLIRCHPEEMSDLMLSYSFLEEVMDYTRNAISEDFCYLSKDLILKFKEYRATLESLFNRENLRQFKSVNEINLNIFQPGISPDIEFYSNRNEEIKGIFKEAAITFSKIVDDNRFVKGDTVIKCEPDEAKGIELFCTLKRGEKLKLALNKNITVVLGKEKFKRKDFKVINNKKSYIANDYLNNLSFEYIANIVKMKKLIIEKYNTHLQSIYSSYNKIQDSICLFVSELDIAACNACCATEFGYCRPELAELVEQESFLETRELRHPLVERLQCNQATPYIANDIQLNKDTKGILLFGTNACGKSTLMKAIGLTLIMAQSGMYVPADEFRFSPYKYFFTRILGNDNIYRGLSSFAVEMTELRSILKRTNGQGLVLGDEVCNGTESRSALAIVTAAIMRMSDKKSSFIFATHLHELNNMEELQNISSLKKKHLKIQRDGNLIIYDRKLEEGSGPAVYGLEVAKAMDLDSEFIENANKILIKMKNKSVEIVEDHPSHFNHNVNVTKCKICEAEAEEVHHIKEQHTADANGMIGNLHKNSKSNLVPLCKECHLKQHHGKLNIKGYIQTSGGPKLDYEITSVKPIKKSKYSNEQLELIDAMKLTIPIRSRAVRELNKKGINISSATLKRYWAKN